MKNINQSSYSAHFRFAYSDNICMLYVYVHVIAGHLVGETIEGPAIFTSVTFDKMRPWTPQSIISLWS